MKVAVVGAGLAGLAAADELQRAGHEVRVFEARSRIGGRVWSRELENGAVVEMGAEFVLPGNTVVRELAERRGLGLWDKGMRYGRREPRGGPALEPGALDAAVASMAEALAANPSARATSAAEFLDSLPVPAAAREVIRARIEISSASDASSVPAAVIAGLGHIDDEPAPSIAGGNDRLASALASGLEREVELGAPVTGIAWGGDGVTLLAGEAEASAEGCVVAVPARLTGEIAFDPPLPPAVTEALGAIRYGHAAKLFAPLSSPAPPSAVMSVPERYWTWTATGEGDRPQPVLNAFAGSAEALERLEIGTGPECWLASAHELRPDLELAPDGALLSTWDDDPWAGAAYSCWVPDAAADALTKPVGPIAFAGEHLGGEFSALMEGALRSGRRAAAALAELAAGAKQ